MKPPIGSITIDIAEDRTLSIRSEGSVDPQAIAIAIFYLNRTANQILDAAVFDQAKRSDPEGLAIVRAMPDASFLPTTKG